MYQDIDPKAENYRALASAVCSNPDQVMMQMFIAELRQRRVRAPAFRGNGLIPMNVVM